MNYVIYADVIFVWLWSVNFITYYIAGNIAGRKITLLKQIVWTIAASIVLEYIYITLIYNNSIINYINYIAISFLLMLIYAKCILKLKQLYSLARLMLYNILGTILLAGILQIFSPKALTSRIILPILLIICLVAPLILKLVPITHNHDKNIYSINLITSYRCISTYGYMDTGNNLMDVYSGKPVIILSPRLLKNILLCQEYELLDKYISTGSYQHLLELKIDGENIYLLPYKTISNDFSIMPVFKIKGLIIDKKQEFKDIVAGIGSYNFSKNSDYMVLLNNNLSINIKGVEND